jgi:homoaconitase/3-isopropylmalate dehydratase large subunit
VTAKDIALRILGDKTASGAQYRSVEFAGDTIGTLSADDRAVLPNMMAEFGAMNAYLPPDQLIFDFIAAARERKRKRPDSAPERDFRNYTPLYPDDDAVYEEAYALDVSQLEPQIALPSMPDNVVNLSDAAGTAVQQAFIGTCTNGRYEDLAAAAEVLRGRRVSIRLIVIPASSQVLQRAIETGVLATLVEAGATLATSGCGPCMGNHMGIPAPSEATISSANRNFRGRMGTPEAPVYLSSPYVVAASAIRGQITDPREFLEQA